jgi:hypothetical protein
VCGSLQIDRSKRSELAVRGGIWDFGGGVWVRYDFQEGELLMASHEKARWIECYWWLFLIAFGIACMLGLDFWHPVLGG